LLKVFSDWMVAAKTGDRASFLPALLVLGTCSIELALTS